MRAVALAIALAACTEPHDDQVVYTPDSCIACHSGTLVHPEAQFPLMSQGTMHDNMTCQICHIFSTGLGLDGVHANCTSVCHLENQTSSYCLQYPQAMNTPCEAIDPSHQGRTNPTTGAPYAWDSVHHDFCVECHPNGLLP